MNEMQIIELILYENGAFFPYRGASGKYLHGSLLLLIYFRSIGMKLQRQREVVFVDVTLQLYDSSLWPIYMHAYM